MKNISEKLDTAASIRNRCARIAIPSCIIGTFIDGISDLLDSEILNYFVWIPMVIGLLSMIRIFNFGTMFLIFKFRSGRVGVSKIRNKEYKKHQYYYLEAYNL